MIEVEWDDSFSVNIDEIDDQHKELFVLLAEFDAAIMEHKTNDVVDEVLSRLVAYTAHHFEQEEELMRAGSYPDIDNHIAQHRKLVEDIVEFKRRADSGEHIAYELNHFLRKWLVNHIKHSDSGYAKYLEVGRTHTVAEWKAKVDVKLNPPKKAWWKFW